MAVSWPAFLQDKLNQAGFSYVPQDNVLRSQTEVGPAKVRPRSTKRVDNLAATILITVDQFQDWDDFFTVDLANGTNQFVFNHPFTGVPTNFRFAKPYKIDPAGGVELSVSMEWEKLP